ncbi:MAG: hypothetical protein WD906_01170 [Anaerolineales bacterium]
MKAIVRWGGLLGAFGGLIWALMFLMEATNPDFDLRNQLLNQPVIAITLVLGIALQAVGFYSLSETSIEFSTPRISATVCAVGALVQSLALLAASTMGLGVAWIFGILGELVITLALGAFAASSLSAALPRTVKLMPFLMLPLYFIGWAIDPETGSVAGLDLVNLSAALYGLLWFPFGYAIWNARRYVLEPQNVDDQDLEGRSK